MNQRLSVGVIGVGSMGANHVRTIARYCPSVWMKAISDADERRMQSLSDEVGTLELYADPMDLIGSVDAVVIASPDETHCEYVMEALRQHKRIFCEKPLASNLEQAVEIVKTEEKLGTLLVSVGFMRRFDNRHVAVKQTLDSRTLGAPLLVKGEHRNVRALYRNDGPFILNNSAGHDVDAACWLLGSTPKEVYCYGLKSRQSLDGNACDLLVVNLLMENGTRALAELYMNASYGYEVNVQVVCQEGTVTTNDGSSVTLRKDLRRTSRVDEDFRTCFAQAYADEMRAWIASLEGGTRFEGATAWDGYIALLATHEAGLSLDTNTVRQIQAIEQPAMYRRWV